MRRLHLIMLNGPETRILNESLGLEAVKILKNKFQHIDNNFAMIKKEIEQRPKGAFG